MEVVAVFKIYFAGQMLALRPNSSYHEQAFGDSSKENLEKMRVLGAVGSVVG